MLKTKNHINSSFIITILNPKIYTCFLKMLTMSREKNQAIINMSIIINHNSQVKILKENAKIHI